jgi:hypothetical protein
MSTMTETICDYIAGITDRNLHRIPPLARPRHGAILAL